MIVFFFVNGDIRNYESIYAEGSGAAAEFFETIFESDVVVGHYQDFCISPPLA